MSPDQAAALIWAIGTGWFARGMLPSYRRFLASDPLNMCDECRDLRRQGSLLTTGAPPAPAAIGIILAAAAWPVLWPARLIRLAIKGRHRCDRAVSAGADRGGHPLGTMTCDRGCGATFHDGIAETELGAGLIHVRAGAAGWKVEEPPDRLFAVGERVRARRAYTASWIDDRTVAIRFEGVDPEVFRLLAP